MSSMKADEAEPQLEANASAQASHSLQVPNSTYDNKSKDMKLKDVDICVPIVYGTIAFYLGRKASESQSHKWTVYVRGANNEELGAVVKRVVFQLHPSFNNPMRVIELPPFEVSPFEAIYRRRIRESTKKPVVMESYNEMVFPDPSETFSASVQNHPAVNIIYFNKIFSFIYKVKYCTIIATIAILPSNQTIAILPSRFRRFNIFRLFFDQKKKKHISIISFLTY